MTRLVEIPVWALVLLVAFAVVTFASHFLFPSVRWFFRRRMERVVAKLNEKLTRPIEPFKLARRHDMIQRLIYDPEVAKAVEEHAREENIPQDVAFEAAHRYAREIVPRFSATAYFGFAIKLAKLISRAFYRVRLGAFDQAGLDKVDPNATVIFVINHRSNMDYVLVTWLAAERTSLSYAVGEWARRWPLRALIRAMGAYFIRRKSRNALYRKVLARYVQMATAGGVTQAIFPEGGLSLNGEVGPPKMGLLNYIVQGFDPESGRDVIFIPVAINYDRVIEDRVLVAADIGGKRKFRMRIRDVARHIARHVWQRLTGRFHRFGYASVSFGSPLSLVDFLKIRGTGNGDDPTKPLAREIMTRIRAVVPVLPVPLVSAILLQDDGLARADIARKFAGFVAEMEASGAHIHMPRDDLDYAVEVGLRLLLLRKLVREEGGRYHINAEDRPVLQFYANSIAHLSGNIPAVSLAIDAVDESATT
ncbi:MAG TPA: glycerol-3-phosphate acyltransferase [Aliiroseovarius sp.]|nr:glycerol-3-phosphate acyltransferase [Aliiroseovarius sp.]